ncbi:DegT/DnrJ/EryC1/StrS family aminotransferase, partial [Candidatus Sumerlaeota bacterium]|nr:DegT/DnrJ/EryC1/StrS family aminotransferase [Candidatus Sumerlaeota bacterium]
DSLCINPELIESSITDKTSAILSTHVYGYPCDTGRIQEIAEKHNLKVVYDAAHCFGEKLDRRSILDFGDISTLSFHATKLFHSAEGGAVICRDKNVAYRVEIMKRFGHTGEDLYEDIGINAKMSELHAAMGLCVLPHVTRNIARRKEIVELYEGLLGNRLVRPKKPSNLTYNYGYFPVIFPSHESMLKVRQALREERINPRRYFYPSINTLPYFQFDGKVSCPVSESIAMRVLCLPLFESLSENDVSSIVRIVLEKI